MDYNQLTVIKLKEELKERGIPSTSLKLKKDLVDRLVQDDEEKATSAEPPTERPDEAGEAPLNQPLDQDPQSPPPKEPEIPNNLANESSLPPEPAQEAVPAETSQPLEEETKAAPAQENQDAAIVDAPSPNGLADSGDNTSVDGKKRKRRSVTPPLSEDVVHKKLKQEADGPVVHLQGDQDQVDMPDAPLEEAGVTVQPMSTSDDVVPISTKESAKPKSVRSPNERRFKELVHSTEPETTITVPEPTDVSVSPAIHPATRALYIRHLVRPINPNALRDHLEDLARPPDDSDASESFVQNCYVDALRTHALVLFTSITAASRARASTHNRIWPAEPMRKPLWVETERASGGSRPSQAKRWELAYDVDGEEVNVRLVVAEPASHRPSMNAGAPNVPTGPRGSLSSGRQPSFSQGDHRRPSQPMLPPPPRRPSRVVEEATAPFLELDKLFRFTATKPKLYWQPVSENLADDRLDELDRETSRDWDPRADARRNGDSLGRGLDQLKRYTFEDGDVLVDGGPEFGGGRAFARNGNRGGRGRRTADSYRG